MKKFFSLIFCTLFLIILFYVIVPTTFSYVNDDEHAQEEIEEDREDDNDEDNEDYGDEEKEDSNEDEKDEEDE